MAKCRVFVTEGNDAWQIFSFSQNPKGDIYCNWPDFEKTEWIFVGFNNEANEHNLIKGNSTEAHKLTFHASGFTAYKEQTTSYENSFTFRSNPLVELGKEGQKLNVRHLFTAQLAKPYHLPSSPAKNRQSDFIITSSLPLEPCIASFFAVPKANLNINIQIGAHIDDISFKENNPDFILGWMIIELHTHNIVCVIYKTKNMVWPSSYHVAYSDGYHIPLIKGLGDRKFGISWVEPKYSLDAQNLSIELNFHNTNLEV